MQYQNELNTKKDNGGNNMPGRLRLEGAGREGSKVLVGSGKVGKKKFSKLKYC